VGAMLGDAVILETIKMAIHSARPLNELINESSFSFPSGHTSGSVVFCGLLTYLAWQHWKSSKVKTSSSMLSVIVTSIVGFDRIYLNVHWFSDVLGGYLLGIFWLTFSILAFQYLEQTRKSRRQENST
jgi:undecaprenyl-diphosphatase